MPNRKGGAVYCRYGDNTFVNCNFEGNHLEQFGYGGAICVQTGGEFTLDRCTFTNNFVGPDDGGIGGAIAFESFGGSALLSKCTFVRNYAWPRFMVGGRGGAIDYRGTSNNRLQIVSCAFLGNRAQTYGGAIYAEPNNSLGIDLTNCTFVGNRADGRLSVNAAGAVSFDLDASLTNELRIVNCTFASNRSSANDGIGGLGLKGHYWGSPPVGISNSIFWGNTSGGGGTLEEQQFRADSSHGAEFAFNRTIVQGWTGSWGGTGNMGSDPLFARTPDPHSGNWGDEDDDYGDLSLTVGSPAIDSGDNTLVLADVSDLDGDGDTTETIPWDGYGNYRFFDDPATSNSGVAGQWLYRNRRPRSPRIRSRKRPVQYTWRTSARCAKQRHQNQCRLLLGRRHTRG